MGWHVFTVTAKSTGGVSFTSAKTSELTVKAYYKSCKAANQVTAVASISPVKRKLGEAASTATAVTAFTTTTAACSKFLVYTVTAPSTIDKTKSGLDAVYSFETNYGQKATWAQIASDKTTAMGSHTFTISAKDWWGNTNDKTGSVKLLLSSDACEKAANTITAVGAEAATYTLGSAATKYTYSVTALSPTGCVYTVASTTIPSAI